MLLADLQRHIEEFAPRAARGDRQRLYSHILAALKAAKADIPEDIMVKVLAAIVARNGFNAARRTEHQQLPTVEQYRKERLRIAKAVNELTESWIVRRFDPSAVELYGFDDAGCPHGYLRKNCEAIRSALTSVRAARAAGMKHGAKAARARLAEANVGTEADPSKFCEASDVHKLLPPLPAPRRAGGRPAERVRLITTKLIVSLLHGDGGLTVERSCELLGDLYRDCLGVQVDAEALRREWYAHGREVESSPDGGPGKRSRPKPPRVKKPR